MKLRTYRLDLRVSKRTSLSFKILKLSYREE